MEHPEYSKECGGYGLHTTCKGCECGCHEMQASEAEVAGQIPNLTTIEFDS